MASAADSVLVFERASAPCYRRTLMEDASDLEIVRCIAGSENRAEAESALCRRFAPRIHLYGMKHLRDADRARDLVQMVLIAVLAAAREGRIDDPARLDRFVFGTCRNTVSRLRLTAARFSPTDDAAIATLATTEPEPVELNALFGCMSALEARARNILMMSFVEERSAEEIATKLATNAGHVRVIRHRALAALRQCLDGRGEASA